MPTPAEAAVSDAISILGSDQVIQYGSGLEQYHKNVTGALARNSSRT